MKKMMSILAALLITVVLAAAVAGFFAYRSIYISDVPEDVSRDFTVYAGESFNSVAMRLEGRGIIPSAGVLQLYSRITSSDRGIQKGSYIIPPGLNAVEVIRYLSSGRQNLIQVTIPEGKTIRQVAAILDEAGITDSREFVDAATDRNLVQSLGIYGETAEGFLFPETYNFAEDFPADKIVAHMISVFYDNLADIYPEYNSLSQKELYETIILASIVEREYLAEDEAPVMASVFYNRLERGMRLESCATVVYVMTEIEGLEHPNRIYFSDLDRPNEFNTYYRSGLPPAPISSIGRVSLSAAFYPAETDYLFFVLESPSAGRHVFSESYEDHQLASEFYYVKLN
ncbi:hypothetical protein L21SP2_1769 [Salinispira pacifica]|uniref:Endolytic murein transglycosylase n=2 Tax=Salinispira pacifica TaxID=1307761 RepID=V5WJ00_9SPIO|nr:hypothetical protein L21SP2_1769 [Salinispira pacifica]